MNTIIDDLIPGQSIVWGYIDNRNTHPYLFNGLVTRRILGWPTSRYEFIPVNATSELYNEESFHEDDHYCDHRGFLHRYRDGRIRNTYLSINTTLRYLNDYILFRLPNEDDHYIYTRTIDGMLYTYGNGTRMMMSLHDVLNMIPSDPPLPTIRVQDDDTYFISREPIQRGDKLYSLGGGTTNYFKWSQNENENELFQYIQLYGGFHEANNKIFIKNPITRTFDIDITTILLGIAEEGSSGGVRSRRSRGGRKGRTKRKCRLSQRESSSSL